MPEREGLLDRFCRYVRIETQSSEQSSTYPSTEGQKDLLRILVGDLRAAGLADAVMDEHGYVMATLPSNLPDGHPAHGKVPVIALLAHVTSAGPRPERDRTQARRSAVPARMGAPRPEGPRS